MAENQEYDEMANGEFQQEGGEGYEQQQDDQVNGEGNEGEGDGGEGDGEQDGDAGIDAPADSGSAEAPGRDDDKKLFVGGLSWETTDKELREHFSKYGDIESINVKTDPNTGRSRGFAFIVFSAAEAIDKVLSAGDHIINNKKVDPKKAKARHGKIFVGGLVPELSDDDIKTFFSQYGTIVEVEMPFDKQKNQRKGFCFITFDSEQVVQELLKTPKQSINGKEVDVKKATPKPDALVRGGRGGVRGARGRGRGGRGRGGETNGWGSQGWGNQGYGNYGGYNQGYGGGYGNYGYGGYDYYGTGYGNYGGYGGYDYTGYNYGNYDYGYGNNYDGGYGRGGRGKGNQGYGGGKQRGGGRQVQRHQPY